MMLGIYQGPVKVGSLSKESLSGGGGGRAIIWEAMVGAHALMKKIPVWKLSLLKDSFNYG